MPLLKLKESWQWSCDDGVSHLGGAAAFLAILGEKSFSAVWFLYILFIEE